MFLFSSSVLSDSFETPWTVAHQAPLSLRFPRQEYWSELPFHSPGDLPYPGIKPRSPALAGGFFTTWENHRLMLPIYQLVIWYFFFGAESKAFIY